MTDNSCFQKDATIGEKYKPAMDVISEEEAAEYLMECINHTMDIRPELSMEEARKIELNNIGYCAGYCDAATAKRVMALFHTAHPIFGGSHPTTTEALESGMRYGRKS